MDMNEYFLKGMPVCHCGKTYVDADCGYNDCEFQDNRVDDYEKVMASGDQEKIAYYQALADKKKENEEKHIEFLKEQFRISNSARKERISHNRERAENGKNNNCQC